MKPVFAEALFAAGVLCCVGSLRSQSYEFTTIAGLGGTSGTADGAGTEARFRYPSGIAVGTNGNVYVTDSQNHTIRCLTREGNNWRVSTIAGVAGSSGAADGTNDQAQFNRPTGIAAEDGGMLYVTDRVNNTVRMLTPQGTNWVVTTIAGSPGQRDSTDGEGASARFAAPYGIVAHPDGTLFVAEGTDNTIRMLTRSAEQWQVTTVAGSVGPGGFVDGAGIVAAFTGPHSIAVDPELNLIVSDWGNHSLRKITGLGADYYVSTISGFTTLSGHVDGPAEQATFYSPDGVVVDGTGNIFVADQGNHTIRKLTRVEGGTYDVTTIGGVALQPGTADGIGTTARFNKPWGMAMDPSGTIYVADYNNHTIRKGSPASAVAPEIKAALITGHIVLSWQDAGNEYGLEVSPDLEANSEWVSVTNDIAVVDGTYTVTNAVKGPSRFYRLRRN